MPVAACISSGHAPARSTPECELTLVLFYAVTRDGRQFTPRQRIATEGVPRHPQIAIDPRDVALVVWDEQVNGTRRIAFGRAVVDVQGMIRVAREVVNDVGPPVYPAVATVSSGFIAAWTSGTSATSVIRVARLPG